MIRRLLLVLAFVVFGYATAAAQRPPARTQRPATSAQQPPIPCTTATPACTEFVAVGGGTGRSLVYRNFPLDTRNEAITRAVIVVHGAGRDAMADGCAMRSEPLPAAGDRRVLLRCGLRDSDRGAVPCRGRRVQG